jgi:hypothetical protein
MSDNKLNILRKEFLAYLVFLVSSVVLIALFMNVGKREGHIVSSIKWAFFELALTVNLIFLSVAILRFYLKKRILKTELILTVLGVLPIITLWIYTVLT